MNLAARAPWLNEQPWYFSAKGHASSIRSLHERTEQTLHLDGRGLAGYFRRKPDGTRTCFAGIRRVPAGCDVFDPPAPHGSSLRRWIVRRRALPPTDGDVERALEGAVTRLLQHTSNPVLALSGGLDSALVFSLAQKVSGRKLPCLTLAFGDAAYCELRDTEFVAGAIGVSSLLTVRHTPEELAKALPETIAACETPLFNLHPASKLLLANAAAKYGYDAIVTGDGADQVFASSDPRNYIPLIGAIVRSTGVRLLSPFFDEHVIAAARCHPAGRDKNVLRRLAATRLPAELAWRRKLPRLAPDLPLNHFRHAEAEELIARAVGQPPAPAGVGIEQNLWATASLLIRHVAQARPARSHLVAGGGE